MTTQLERAGAIIRNTREGQGYSQGDAAAEATRNGTKVSTMTWRKIERGAPDVRTAKLVAVDRALGWPPGTTEQLRSGILDAPPAVDSGAPVYDSLEAVSRQLARIDTALTDLAVRVGRLEQRGW